jgi:GT2 family glycosyltransferase
MGSGADNLVKMARPTVSIVMATYQRLPFLKAAIASIRASDLHVPYEIIVVDGGSKDGSLEWLALQEDILTILHHNREVRGNTIARRRSWGYFVNLGFKCAQGLYICMLSDDTVVYPDTIANGVSEFDRKLAQGRRLGGLAFYWRSWPEESQYRVCRTIGARPMVNHGLFLRNAIEQVGWIEEDLYSFYHADSDLCLKLWHAGFEIAACEAALVEHYERADVQLREGNMASFESDWEQLKARWTGIYFDPANPNPGFWSALEGVKGREARGLFPDCADAIGL